MNLKEKRIAAIRKMQELTALDSMNEEQIAEFDRLEEEVRGLDTQIAAMEQRQQRSAALVATTSQRTSVPERNTPAILRGERGDNEANAWKAYFAYGDSGGLSHLRGEDERGQKSVVLTLPPYEQRAAVDSTMNITTGADGGYLVPTGFAGIVAVRKNERMLAPRLGCRLVPGIGTTVNYPYESADPDAFATTAETADDHTTVYERSTAPTGLKAFTLVKKTRKVDLTEELLEDNAVNVQNYVADRIAREIAKTHNAMLDAEVEANGTNLKSFASNSAIAAGELEPIVGNDALGFYLEDSSTASWVMRSSTHWAIKAITGNNRMYAGTEAGLLGYNVTHSNAVDAIGAGGKSVLFGDWDYVGYRESNEIRFISDPYTVDGLVILKYSFRAVYGILQPAAIGYGVHP